MAGCVEGIRRGLVLDLVLIAGTAIEQAPSVGHLLYIIIIIIVSSNLCLPSLHAFLCHIVETVKVIQ